MAQAYRSQSWEELCKSFTILQQKLYSLADTAQENLREGNYSTDEIKEKSDEINTLVRTIEAQLEPLRSLSNEIKENNAQIYALEQYNRHNSSLSKPEPEPSKQEPEPQTMTLEDLKRNEVLLPRIIKKQRIIKVSKKKSKYIIRYHL